MDSKFITVYENNDYSVTLEYNEDLAALHLPVVSNFNVTVLKSMQKKVIELLDFLTDLGYNGIWANCKVEDTKIQKLLHLLGFEYVTDKDGTSIFNIGVI